MDSSSSRLDVVKWWRGRQELDARRAYGEAKSKEQAAREAEQKLRDELAKEKRAEGNAAMWELSDLARAAEQRKLKAAAEVTAKAAKVATEKQAAHLGAHQKLKAVEKVVEGLLEEAHAEERRKERKATDEFTMLQFAR